MIAYQIEAIKRSVLFKNFNSLGKKEIGLLKTLMRNWPHCLNVSFLSQIELFNLQFEIGANLWRYVIQLKTRKYWLGFILYFGGSCDIFEWGSTLNTYTVQ